MLGFCSLSFVYCSCTVVRLAICVSLELLKAGMV